MQRVGSRPKKSRAFNQLAVRFANANGAGASETAVSTAEQAREQAVAWIEANLGAVALQLGLPEVDDRYQAWRVALLNHEGNPVGEVMIACADGSIVQATRRLIIQSRLFPDQNGPDSDTKQREFTTLRTAESEIVWGDSRVVLRQLPDELFGLAITSPPYYNAKPQYSEYTDYAEYLTLLRDVFKQCHRTLQEGRFLIVNASPVLVRRPSRSKSSRRIPVPFHINQLLEEIGFEFLDDIIWVKPTGAGWNTGRGRRFAADRQPLQYKPVPVTE